MEFESVIGLEVHAQLKTVSKIFCGCSTAFGASPNTHVCPVCLGMPGVLPVLNQKVVEYALRLALATDCQINQRSRFARKNYFYPDLPKGYQISQYELPLAEHGCLTINVDDVMKKIGITRIHMEEDAGKLIHDPDRPISKVDFNRTGVPLIEIVSEPDMRSPAEAGAYLRKLRSIVRYLDICDGNMEEGSFRCDANISIRPKGQEKLGTRTELKNLNSFKHVEKALQYEIQRQIGIVMEGGTVEQKTRLWDPEKNRSYSMRGKEEAHDYRYFPDPDLLPVVVDETWIQDIKAKLPELPEAKKQRFIREYDLPEYDADFLTGNKETAAYFEACLSHINQPKLISNWMMGHLTAMLNSADLTFDRSPVSPERLAALLDLLQKDTISAKIAKTVFDEMLESSESPLQIVEKKGLMQVSDTSELENLIDGILSSNPDEVTAYQNGKTKLMGFFVGQIMKATKGKANPKVVNELLVQKLNN